MQRSGRTRRCGQPLIAKAKGVSSAFPSIANGVFSDGCRVARAIRAAGVAPTGTVPPASRLPPCGRQRRGEAAPVNRRIDRCRQFPGRIAQPGTDHCGILWRLLQSDACAMRARPPPPRATAPTWRNLSSGPCAGSGGTDARATAPTRRGRGAACVGPLNVRLSSPRLRQDLRLASMAFSSTGSSRGDAICGGSAQWAGRRVKP